MTSPHQGQSRPGFPPIARKILVAVLSGGIAYLVTQTASGPGGENKTLWELTIAIFIAGVTLVVQFITELDERVVAMESHQTEHHAAMKGLVEQKFSAINEATELFGLVEGSALETEQIIQLIRHSTKIQETTSPIVRQLAEAEVSRMSTFLKELSNGGTVTYEGEDRDWLLALTAKTQHTLDATSPNSVDSAGDDFDSGFWLTDLGQRYLDLQRDIVQRGGRVRRVFIVDDDDLTDPRFLQICRRQKEAGIMVRVLTPAGIVNVPRIAIFGFVVFDGELSYEVTPSSRISQDERPTIVNTCLVLQESRVRERIRHFNVLWENSEDIDC